MKSIFLLNFCFAFMVLCSAVEESDSSDDDYVSDFIKYPGGKIKHNLYGAIEYGNLTTVQLVLDRGLHSYEYFFENKTNMFHDLLIHSICPRKKDLNEEIFQFLLKNVTNLDTFDSMGRSPLFQAIKTDCVKAIKILLEHGANPNAYYEKERFFNINERFNMTALDNAFFYDNIDLDGEIIKLLIEHGADINQADEYGQTPLHQAIIEGKKEIIELLIKKGANVNAVENRGRTNNMTPLHYIVALDSSPQTFRYWSDDDTLKYAEMLIDHGADLYAKAHYTRVEISLTSTEPDKEYDGTPLDMAENSKLRKLLGSKMGAWEWLKTIW